MLGAENALQTQSDLVLDLLSSLSAVLKPLQKLESLAAFESMRQEENPLLPTIQGVVTDASAALAATQNLHIGTHTRKQQEKPL